MLRLVWVLILTTIFVLAAVSFAFVPPQQGSQAEWHKVPVFEKAPPTPEAQASWASFTARQGQAWQALWNPLTATPHRIIGKGIRLAQVVTPANVRNLTDSFLNSESDLLGVDPQDLRLLSQEKHGARWYTDYQQTYHGLDVIGGKVHIRLREDGKVTVFGSDFYNGIDISTSPTLDSEQALRLAKQDVNYNEKTDEVRSSRLVILPVVEMKTVSFHLAYELRLFVKQTPALWRIYVDAHDGSILRKVNEIHYDMIDGSVSGYIKPMYISDPDAEEAFIDQFVTVTGYGTDTTDASGYYAIEAGSGGTRELKAALSGRWAIVTNNNGPEASFLDSISPGNTVSIVWNDSISRADERNAYYHTNMAHARIKAIDPSFTGMDRQTPIRVNQPDYCNAYWDGNGITLGAGSGSCQNLAMFCDVIYHEYGHGITDFIYRPLAPSGAMHEAFSDYFACTITNEPLIGEYVIGSGYFRNLDNNLKYPDDLTGEVHDDGRILAGSLWDMRQALLPDVHLADSLFHYARYGKADNFFDYYYDVLETDDDDGDLTNGTPHYYEIVEAFGKHGIGPGLYIKIAHEPVKDTEDSTQSFVVVATITSNVTLNPDSLMVFYSVGAGYSTLLMNPTGNPDEYSATIPAQSYGTTVNYYIYAQGFDIGLIATDPDSAPTYVHSFSIGTDTEPPTIVHMPLEDQPDAAWPVTVSAEVTDNLGLASVVLEYSKNGVPQTSIPMSNVSGNTYEATFAVAASVGDQIAYRIVAMDASAAAHVTYEPPTGYHDFGIAHAYYYTFESGDEGWTHRAGTGWNDEWHLSTERNHTDGGNTSWKCGSSTGGEYGANLKAFLESPVITLGPGAKLVFWHWIDAETYEPVQGSGLAWDGAALSLIDSAGKATPIDPVDGYPYRILEQSSAPFTANKPVYSGHSDWQVAIFDLSFYEGPCQFRLKFGSDGYVGGEGWYIDDVMIWSQDALAGLPACDDNCDQDLGVPLEFGLGPAIPNPTRGSVKIAYAVPSASDRIVIKIYDIQGRLAAKLLDGAKTPGWYSVTWDGSNASGTRVAPGIYFVRMEAKDFTRSMKVMLLK